MRQNLGNSSYQCTCTYGFGADYVTQALYRFGNQRQSPMHDSVLGVKKGPNLFRVKQSIKISI